MRQKVVFPKLWTIAEINLRRHKYIERYPMSLTGRLNTLKHQYYTKWTIDSMQSLLNFQRYFCGNRKIYPIIYFKSAGTLHTSKNLEKAD